MMIRKNGWMIGISLALSLCMTVVAGRVMAQPGDGDKKNDSKAKESLEAKKNDPSITRIYTITFKGEYGRDVSTTPVRKALADAKKEQADIILLVIDCSFTIRGQTAQEYATFVGQRSWDSVDTAREMATFFHEGIRDDADWKTRAGTKPRLVVWVKNGMGPVCFFALSFKEIYFAPSARLGGVGYLDYVFEGVGDEVVREKQRSLRMGRFEGLVRQGGYPMEIVRAMSRSDENCSVTFEGDKPVFHADLTGEEILCDGADRNRRDTMEQLVRLEGNDVLTLNARIAQKLGVSKGVVSNEDDLVAALGVERGYVMLNERANRIFKNWSQDVSAAETDFRKLWRDYNDIRINGRNANERNSQRGKQLKILNDIKSKLETYKEAINPREIQGAPKDWVSEINVMIERIKTDMRLDR